MPSTMRPTCNANSTRAPTGPGAVVLDLPVALLRAVSVSPMRASRVRQTLPDAKIGVIASATHWVDDVIVEWARRGADTPSPRSTLALEHDRRAAAQRTLIGDRDTVDAAMRRITLRCGPLRRPPAARAGSPSSPPPRPMASTAALAFRMQRPAVSSIADRSYLLRVYRNASWPAKASSGLNVPCESTGRRLLPLAWRYRRQG